MGPEVSLTSVGSRGRHGEGGSVQKNEGGGEGGGAVHVSSHAFSPTPGWRGSLCGRRPYAPNTSSNPLASWKSGVSKPSGNPAEDGNKKIMGLGALALVLPQATQAHGRPQL